MQRDHEHARVVGEDVLRAVAVMDVPVEDADPLEARGERRMRRDRGRVRQAEPHRPRSRSAWWPGGRTAQKTRRRRDPASTSATASHAAPPRAAPRAASPGPPRCRRRASPPAAARSSASRYPAGWTRSSSSARRLPRLALVEPGADGADTCEHRGEAAGRLGMAARRGMVRACGVGTGRERSPMHTC